LNAVIPPPPPLARLRTLLVPVLSVSCTLVVRGRGARWGEEKASASLLVPEKEPAGGLVCPPVAECAEPVLELEVVTGVGLVQQKLQVVEEQLVVQEQPQRRRAVLAEKQEGRKQLALRDIYGQLLKTAQRVL
jgi:hypothetical protein